MVTVAARTRRDRPSVRSCLRLRDRKRRNRAAVGDERQIPSGERGTSCGCDRIAAEALHGEYRVDEATCRGEILARQAQRAKIQSGAAMFKRNEELAEAVLRTDANRVAPGTVDIACFTTVAERRNIAGGRRERLLQLPVPLLEEWQIERRLRERQRSPFRAMNAS